MQKNQITLFSLMVLAGFVVLGCQAGQVPSNDITTGLPGDDNAKPATSMAKVYSPSMSDCAGFSSADAAKITGVPAAEMKLQVNELYSGNWSCYFEGPSYDKSISFNVTVSESVQDAVDDMVSYRSNLGLAHNVIPGEDQSTAAYQEVSGVGDEALYTTVNNSLSARKGNIQIQIISPEGIPATSEVANTFFAKL